MSEKYFLPIYGSSIDIFYSGDYYPHEGNFTHGKFKGRMAGGPPLNVSVNVASKGIDVKPIDLLNNDSDTTTFLIDFLKSKNIDTSNICFSKNATNAEVVIITTGDKRTMFVIDPVREKYVIDDKLQDLLNNASYMYSLMHIINRSFDNLEPLLIAKKHGAKIILDGSSKYEDQSRANILYSLADGLFINDEDFKCLEKVSNSNPIDILMKNNAEFVVVTHGSKGSDLYYQGGHIYCESCPTSVIDSTGAGDNFAGCFIACLMKGYSYNKAIRLASVNGAYACTGFGGNYGDASEETLCNFAKEHGYEIGE